MTCAVWHAPCQVVDPYELALVKLPPPPLPSAWGRVVRPYMPAHGGCSTRKRFGCTASLKPSHTARARSLEEVKDAKHIATDDILKLDTQKARAAVVALPVRNEHLTARAACPRMCICQALGSDFLGVLLNPPWATVTPKQIESLSLPKLCPVGFVFVWVDKEVLDQVVDVLVRMKYMYVENLTWVLMAPNNRVRTAAAHPLPAGAVRKNPSSRGCKPCRSSSVTRLSSGARIARCSSSAAMCANSPRARKSSCATSAAPTLRCRWSRPPQVR